MDELTRVDALEEEIALMRKRIEELEIALEEEMNMNDMKLQEELHAVNTLLGQTMVSNN